MTAGVHDATAAEPATETEGIGLPSVDVHVDACTTTNGEHVSTDVVVTSGKREESPAGSEASVGGQIVTMLGKPLRYGRNQLDSSLQTLGRFFDLAAQAFVYLITDLIRLRHPWRDTINQALSLIHI